MVVFLHTKPVLSSLVLGTKIEGGIILILLAFWSALVAVVSDTRHGLATDSSGSISNGNLYYFSWGGLATGVALMLSYVRSVYGIDITSEIQNKAKRVQYWAWLGIIGLIQMGSSARLFDNHCGLRNSGLGDAEIGSVKFCRRCQMGIVLGIFSAVLSVAVVGIKMGTKSSSVVPWVFSTEMAISGILVISQAIGVAFLTSQEGPGAPLNNLFYSSWGSFVLTLVLGASCLNDWSAASSTMNTNNGRGSAASSTMNMNNGRGNDGTYGSEGESPAMRQSSTTYGTPPTVLSTQNGSSTHGSSMRSSIPSIT